jgi:hypothetical protein
MGPSRRAALSLPPRKPTAFRGAAIHAAVEAMALTVQTIMEKLYARLDYRMFILRSRPLRTLRGLTSSVWGSSATSQ